MELLGEDGRGYELAQKLEQCGAWRLWFGETNYTLFTHFLQSPSLWESFMCPDDTTTRAQIQLQLRARALLFDKAAASIFLCSHHSSSPPNPSNFSSGYLQLHVDDVYFSLEDDSFDKVQYSDTFSHHAQHKASSLIGHHNASRSGESSLNMTSNIGPLCGESAIHDTWYDQVTAKIRRSGQSKSYFGGEQFVKLSRDKLSKYLRSFERTPEGMCNYIKHYERHKKKRQVLKNNPCTVVTSTWKNCLDTPSLLNACIDRSSDEDGWFIPEVMFPSNCVPDTAFQISEGRGFSFQLGCSNNDDVVPTTPDGEARNQSGTKPHCLTACQRRCRLKESNSGARFAGRFSKEQADSMARKAVALLLTNVGLEGASEVSIKTLSQLLNCRICKLGSVLRILSDNYGKKCSALELLKMFLHSMGYSPTELTEILKDGTCVASFQAQQQGPARQMQQGSPIRASQVSQQMRSQMHIVHSQNLVSPQHKSEKSCKYQATTSCGSAIPSYCSDPLLKESSTKALEDGGTSVCVSKQEVELKQQQLAMGFYQNQTGRHLKQLPSLLVPHPQAQGIFSARPQPVKVEGFQELMGGETTPKQESSEQSRLTTPKK